MAKVVVPKYPDALTVKSWNKAKGLLARITKVKTGITEELTAAHQAYLNAPWAELNATAFATKYDKSGTKTQKSQEALLRLYLEKNHPPFKELEKTFYLLSSFLKQKAAEFAKDEKTKTFAKAALLMADAANKFTYAVAFGTVSSAQQAEMTKWIKEAAGIEKLWAQARQKLVVMINAADSAVSKAKSKTPTAKDYASLWKEELRGIGAQIQMAGKGDPTLIDKFKAPMDIAKKQWMDSALPKKDEDVAAQIKLDVVLVGKFKKIASTL